MKLVAAITLCALLGCVTHHRVVVDGKHLLKAVPALEKTGTAIVQVEDLHNDHARGSKGHEELRLEQSIGGGDEGKPVRDWIVDCGATRPESRNPRPCVLGALGDVPIEVRRFETTSVKPVIGGVVFGVVTGTLVASIVCGFACADGSNAKEASKYTLIGEGVLLGAGLVWGLITCFGGRTCRD